MPSPLQSKPASAPVPPQARAVGVERLVVRELLVVEPDLVDEVGVVPLDAGVGDGDVRRGRRRW